MATIYGTSANDFLSGGTDGDLIYGNAGNDTLDGGLGNDMMQGGAGNDLYIIDSIGDVIIEYANEGTDRVSSSISYTLGANLEDLRLTGSNAIHGIGNELNNTITGNSANNSLNGGAGNDTLDVAACI